MHKKILFLTSLIAVAAGCNLFQKKSSWSEAEYYTDTAEAAVAPSELGSDWSGPNEILYRNYKASVTKLWDLQHTALDLRFNFDAREVKGTAELRLQPHWEALDTLVLDARDMRIESVFIRSAPNAESGYEPKWSYTDSAHLRIALVKKHERNEPVNIRIQYTALPYQSAAGGGDAISSDRGLYFINHNLADPIKPRQIWTQGETESSSHWFPTLDAPNQKTTLRIRLFVPDTMVTLSNGKLTQSIATAEPGLRMDEWEQKQPHAPYLTMIAVGNWAVIKDKWKDKEVNYLVEKKYAPYAHLIFGNTPKMMEFFSNYTGIPYPWDKYSQVVVREFVSGAMENTTATVHSDGLQHTAEQHLDDTYEDYISHELFHQWFGDLVTTESWSNLTLNESFATYAEYLWREHFYGLTDAQFLLFDLRDQYFFAGLGEGKHLVRYEYENELEMFDNISYQKGACILHMLRYTIGEDAFREGMKRYLEKYRFQSAEVAQFRIILEDITGRDLNWFFDQWYFDSDHPEIQLGIEQNSGEENYKLRIEQTQENRNCYAFPVKIKWGVGTKSFEKNIFVTERIHMMDMGTTKPDWFIFDADNALLAEVSILNKDLQECADNIRALHKAMAYAGTEGTKHNILELACQIADDNDGFSDVPELTSALKPFFSDILGSTYDHSLQKILDFSLSHPWYLESNSEKILTIAQNLKQKTDTRISALNKLIYMQFPDDSLMAFTNDSSPSIARFAIGHLRKKEVWQTYAETKGVNSNRGHIAVAWMQKLLLAQTRSFSSGLHALAEQPAVGLEDYQNALNILFYYCPDESIIEQATLLAEKLKAAGKKQHLQLLSLRLEAEVVKLDKFIKEVGAGNTFETEAETEQQRSTAYKQIILKAKGG